MMRKLMATVMVAGAMVLGGFAKDASAGATVDLLFISVDGGSITPTNQVTVAAAGARLEMILRLTTSEPLSAHGVSINYDLEGNSVLDILHRGNWAGIAMNAKGLPYAPLPAPFSPNTDTFVGTFQSTNGGSTTVFLPASGAGGYEIGTVVWNVTGAGGTSTNLIVGLLNPGVDGILGNTFSPVSTLFNGATVNVIPEPGTAALVGIGLVGLVLAGRRSRA